MQTHTTPPGGKPTPDNGHSYKPFQVPSSVAAISLRFYTINHKIKEKNPKQTNEQSAFPAEITLKALLKQPWQYLDLTCSKHES